MKDFASGEVLHLIWLGFSPLFHKFQACFDFISAYFDLISVGFLTLFSHFECWNWPDVEISNFAPRRAFFHNHAYFTLFDADFMNSGALFSLYKALFPLIEVFLNILLVFNETLMNLYIDDFSAF